MATLVQAPQRSEQWFAARLGRATASRFNDVMAKTKTGYGAQRKNYMAELTSERLTGTQNDNFTSTAMQWGIDHEDTARLEYELETGNDVEETSFWQHDSLMAGASPDGLIGEDGLLEIKCPNTATHIETLQTKKLPRQYYWQVMGQMWIMGRKWCDFMSYDPRMPENAQKIIIRVGYDEDKANELEAEVTTFLDEVDKQVEFVKSYK